MNLQWRSSVFYRLSLLMLQSRNVTFGKKENSARDKGSDKLRDEEKGEKRTQL